MWIQILELIREVPINNPEEIIKEELQDADTIEESGGGNKRRQKKLKKHIWKKRTVGEAFYMAWIRFNERKNAQMKCI